MAKLESLIVDLQANTAKLQEGLDDANKRLKGFGDNFKKMAGIASGAAAFAVLGTAALEAGKAVAEFAARGIDSLDRLGKQAGQLGTSSEEFSKLAFAFQLTGVEGEAFAKFMGQLGKNLSAAAAGSKEQVALFSALGVSAVDASGRVRDTSAVVTELAGAFAAMNDGPAKAAIAVELFGKGGEAMLDTLNKGSAGLAAAGLEAEKYGAVVSGPAAAAAGAFKDTMAKLKAIADALAMSLGAELLPTLNQLLASILKSDGAMQGLVSTAATIGEWFRVIIAGADIAADVFVGLAEVVSRTASATRAFLSASDPFEGWDAAEKHLRGIAKAWDDMRVKSASTALSWVPLPNLTPPAPPAAGPTKSAEAVLRATKSAGDAAKKALEDQKKAADEAAKAMADLKKEAEGLEKKVTLFGNKDPLAEMEHRLSKGDLAESLAKVGDQAGVMRERILAAAKALAALESAKFEKELGVTVQAQRRGLTTDMAARESQYQLSKMSPEAAARYQTGAHGNRAQALEAYAKYMEQSFELGAQAARAAKDNNLDAQQQYLSLQHAAEQSAESAMRAADAHAQIEEAARQQGRKVAQGFAAVGMSMVGKMEDLGDVMNAGIQGFQQGGPWVALAAVVMELFSKFEGFGQIVDYGNRQLKMVMDVLKPAFDELLKAVMTVMEASGPLTKAIFSSLVPVIKAISGALDKVFKVLKPIFSIISMLTDMTMPVIDALQSLADAFDPFEIGLQVLGTIFNVIGLVMLGIARGVVWVVEGVLYIVKGISDFFGGNAGIDKAYNDVADAGRKMDEKLKYLSENLTNVNATFEDPPDLEDTKDGLAEFTSALTNAPAGFRYAAAAFDAQGYGSEAVFGQAPAEEVTNITLKVDAEKLADIMHRTVRRRSFRRDGWGEP